MLISATSRNVIAMKAVRQALPLEAIWVSPPRGSHTQNMEKASCVALKLEDTTSRVPDIWTQVSVKQHEHSCCEQNLPLELFQQD